MLPENPLIHLVVETVQLLLTGKYKTFDWKCMKAEEGGRKVKEGYGIKEPYETEVSITESEREETAVRESC